MQVDEQPLSGWGGSHSSCASVRSLLSPQTGISFWQVAEQVILGGSHCSSELITPSPHFQQTEGEPAHLYPLTIWQRLLQECVLGGSHVYLFSDSTTLFPHL